MKDIDMVNTYMILLDNLEDKPNLKDFMRKSKKVLKLKDPSLARKMR